MQFGYLSLFSCVYPLTPVLLLLNNVTEIRGDAYKICKLFRKPFCAPVASMGVWQVRMLPNRPCGQCVQMDEVMDDDVMDGKRDEV